jgi:hypothetical protein
VIVVGFIFVISLLALSIAAWVKLEIYWHGIKKMRKHEPR